MSGGGLALGAGARRVSFVGLDGLSAGASRVEVCWVARERKETDPAGKEVGGGGVGG